MRFSKASRALATIGLVITLTGSLAGQHTEYVIGPNDVLNITVWGPGGSSVRLTVESDGNLTFPIMGRITAGGLTVRQLQDDLTSRLRDGYFNDPRVTVVIKAFRASTSSSSARSRRLASSISRAP